MRNTNAQVFETEFCSDQPTCINAEFNAVWSRLGSRLCPIYYSFIRTYACRECNAENETNKIIMII